MSQRLPATATRTNESFLAPPMNRQASSSSSSDLDPASKHPLYLSPSATNLQIRPSSAARRRQRQEDGLSGASGYEEYSDAKGKNRYDASRSTSTLDKLEGWFGLSPGESSTAASARAHPAPTHTSASTTVKHRPSISRTTKLVVVHHITPADTLESLALRYNTDVRTLRRANGLWPGDSVLVRKELYIPVEEGSAHAQGGITEANEGLDGKLKLLNSQTNNNHSNGHFPGRSLSVASASSASAASQSHSSNANGSWQEVRRMPTESLSHFPPPGSTASTIGKGKAKDEDAFGYAEGLKPGWDVDHGESGVDDLLQLAEKARSRGPSPPAGVEASRPIQRPMTPPPGSSQMSSPSSSIRAFEEPWKPNKYTFGQKKSVKNATTSSPPANSMALINEADSRGPAMMVAASYKGWNDIPEPPLHVTAKGKVAHAYKGGSKRRYPRPGTVDFAPGNIIEDLATGLLPNAGPASNWARPIAESLPVPADGGRNVRFNQLQSNLGWGQILSDTVRGKMALEEALERGLEDIRSLAGGVGSTNINSQVANGTMRRAMMLHSDLNTTSSSRPSAELARVTLGEGSSMQPGQTVTTTNGLDVRRSSGRSMHELEDLRGPEEDRSQSGQQDWPSSSWATTAANSSEGGRRVRKNVDWLT
jgi:LysM repeat protein